LCVLALGARPLRLWPRAGCFAGSYCHSRLHLEPLGLVLSVSRILLSVLLFAGAFTRLLDGRLDSVRILAQNLRPGRVLIKRFPYPNGSLFERALQFHPGTGYFHSGPQEPLMPREMAEEYSPFFDETICCPALILGESSDSGRNPRLNARAKFALFPPSLTRFTSEHFDGSQNRDQGG